MKNIYILLIILLIPLPLHCQLERMYENLTEPAIRRPLTMYGGQLQLNSGYELITGNKQFDDSGHKIGVKEAASTGLSNNFLFGLNYGIIDYIELNASIWYLNTVVSDPSVILVDYESFNYFDRIYNTRGMSDLYLGLTLRLPLVIDWLDWTVSIGSSLPTAAHEPDQPGHTYEIWDPASASFQISYKDYPKHGKGVAQSQFSSSLRLNTEKLGFWLNYRYFPVSKEIETSQWKHRLVNGRFDYIRESYLLKNPSELYLDLSAGYQAFSWFIAYTNFFYESFSGGWTESSGQRIAFPESSLAVLSLSFEIQVSTHLRFEQYINFPLAGKNSFSSFSFFTGISYNLVPLKNLYY